MFHIVLVTLICVASALQFGVWKSHTPHRNRLFRKKVNPNLLQAQSLDFVGSADYIENAKNGPLPQFKGVVGWQCYAGHPGDFRGLDAAKTPQYRDKLPRHDQVAPTPRPQNIKDFNGTEYHDMMEQSSGQQPAIKQPPEKPQNGSNIEHISYDIRGQPKPGWCQRSPYIIASQEDVLSGSTQCSDLHVLDQKGELGIPFAYNNLYGRLLSGQGNQSFYYVEIPMTASSTIKEMVSNLCQNGAVDTDPTGPNSNCGELNQMSYYDTDVFNITAFTFLRHPIARFISGYAAVVRQVKNVKDASLQAILSPGNFSNFVKMFVKEGSKILQKGGVVMAPLMSQTFFLNLWPGQIKFVGRVEAFFDSVVKLEDMLGKNLTIPEHISLNETDMDNDLLNDHHADIQLLHDYFRDEIERFGYGPFSGYH